MITADEAKKYVKEFVPSQDIINEVESQIKKGNRHIQVFTTPSSTITTKKLTA